MCIVPLQCNVGISCRMQRPVTTCVRPSPRTAPAASWFADWVARHEFSKVAGVTSRSMRVRTTLDRRVQAIAENVVNKALERSGPSLGASQAALIAIRRDGSVVAMVGGRNYQDSQFNRAVDARRQPGSTFKLFVFYAALRHGYSPDSIVDASPIEIRSWRSENYGGQSYGSLTLWKLDAFRCIRTIRQHSGHSFRTRCRPRQCHCRGSRTRSLDTARRSPQHGTRHQ